LQLGLERYHGVGIIGFNSPEWFISDLAAIFAGLVNVFCQIMCFSVRITECDMQGAQLFEMIKKDREILY